ncbi:uncharacterized protein LOC118182651 [Stegodyphus dumicola]|uniref:uncharacterized protein LOC118182651 n=1 Tax=Stegodyphus dumicola TaxID=202533 RepID=UPI0015AFA8D1|nr:uncharacterized protein LOC118182651 [Stegodyphus dumicola]
MNYYFVITICITLFLQFIAVLCNEKPPEPKVGEPQFKLDAVGGGNNLRNFQTAFNAGVGTKVWESKKKDMSLEVGATYGRGIARVDGHTFKSPPQYGLGTTFRWGKKR